MLRHAFFAGIFLIVLFPVISFSKVIYVPSDQPDIQTGIDSATVGDVVMIECGTYYEHDITMKSGVWLRSEYNQPGCVTIDAQSLGRVIFCDEQADVTISGLTITGGYAANDEYGGGIHSRMSTITIDNCVIRNNAATGAGGGVEFYAAAGNSVIMDCEIIDNTARWGGGIDCGASCPTIAGCLIEGNYATTAGGGIIIGDGAPNIGYSIIADNYTCGSGSAIYSWDSDPVILNCTFYNNIGTCKKTGSTELPVSDIDFSSRAVYIDNSWVERYDSDDGYRPASSPAEEGTIDLRGSSIFTMQRTIIAFGRISQAIYCAAAEDTAFLTCCDVYGNQGGDWFTSIAWQADINGNFSLDPMFCDTAADNLYIDANSPCRNNNNECHMLIGALGVGCTHTDIDHDDGLALNDRFGLAQNYPNPFNPSTTIEYSIPERTHVTIAIYNLLGQKICSLVEGIKPRGTYMITWDGTDHWGSAVPAGIYFCRVGTGSFIETRKMLFLK